MASAWKRWRSGGCAVALVTVVGACGGDPTDAASGSDAGPPPAGLSPEQAARVVAKVGDRTITLGDYATTLERMDQFDRLRYQTKEARRELLKEMVDVELLAQEARKRKLDEQPATQAAVRQILGEALLSDVRSSLPAPAELTAEEVRAYYDAHRDDFREPERRRVSAIVVKDAKDAKDALETLRKDRKDDGTIDASIWGKLFSERSTATPKGARAAPADLAGDLGIVGPPDDAKGSNPRVPEAVRRAVFTLAKVGTFTDGPVEDNGRLYLVRLSGLTGAHERSLAEADRTIRVAILKERLEEKERSLEAELRKKFEVSIDDVALAKLAPPEAAKAATASPSAPADESPAPPGSADLAPSAVPSAGASAGAPSGSAPKP